MAHNVRPTTLIGIKRLAKHLKKERGLEYAKALDEASRQSGFQDFRHARAQLENSTHADAAANSVDLAVDVGQEENDVSDPSIRKYIREALKGFESKRWADTLDSWRTPQHRMRSLVLDENQASLINTSSKLERALALNGKQLAMLNEDELLTLQFYIDRGRKYGLQVFIERGEIRVVVQDAKRFDARNTEQLDFLNLSEGSHFALGLKTAREITLENFRGLGMTWIIPKGARVIVNESIGNLILADVYISLDSVLYGVSLCQDDVELNSQPVTTDDSAPSL